MDKIIKNISYVNDVDLLYELKRVLKSSTQYSHELGIIEFICSFYEESGLLPSTDQLLKSVVVRYEDPGYDLRGEELLVAIKNSIVDYRDKILRQSLMEVSSTPVIKAEKIEAILKDLIPFVQNKEYDSVLSYNGQEEYDKVKAKPAGMKFSIARLDEEVSGISYGTMLVLFGFVGSLKTTLALSMAYYNAKTLNYNSVYFSLEVPKRELYFNLLSRHAYELDSSTKIDAKRIKKGLLTEEEESFLWGTVDPDFKAMKGQIIFLDHADVVDRSGRLSNNSFMDSIYRIHNKVGLDAVFCDYVQLIRFFHQSKEQDPINSFIDYFHQMLVTFDGGRGLIGVLLSQVNRTGWQKAVRRGGRYALDAIAEFHNLERNAYYVVPVFFDEALQSAGEVSLQLLKHRAGEVIEEPFTTLAVPGNFFIGDLVGYSETFSEDVLDENLF